MASSNSIYMPLYISVRFQGWVRDHRNQWKNKQDVSQRKGQTQENLKKIAEYLCLLRRWFLCQFEHMSVLYPLLFVLRKYHSLTWKTVQDILLIFLCDAQKLCCTFSQIWAAGNLGAHPETRSSSTVDFPRTFPC